MLGIHQVSLNALYATAVICFFIAILTVGKRMRESAGSNANAIDRCRWLRCCMMIVTILGVAYASSLVVDAISRSAKSRGIRPGSSVVETDLKACFVCGSLATKMVAYEGHVMHICGECEPPTVISQYTHQPHYRQFTPGTGAVELPARIFISILASLLTVLVSWSFAFFATILMDTKLGVEQNVTIACVLSFVFVACVIVFNSTIYAYLGSAAN